MNVVAVVGLRWITRGARVDAPAVTLWILAWAMFFVPLAAAVSELSSRYPEQGGIYAWSRRAFGPVHGFICGWCLWVNNLFYFPSALLFAAANAAAIFGPQGAAMAETRWFSMVFVLGVLVAARHPEHPRLRRGTVAAEPRRHLDLDSRGAAGRGGRRESVAVRIGHVVRAVEPRCRARM